LVFDLWALIFGLVICVINAKLKNLRPKA